MDHVVFAKLTFLEFAIAYFFGLTIMDKNNKKVCLSVPSRHCGMVESKVGESI